VTTHLLMIGLVGGLLVVLLAGGTKRCAGCTSGGVEDDRRPEHPGRTLDPGSQHARTWYDQQRCATTR